MERKKIHSSIKYFHNKYITRNHDLPAIIYLSGNKVWLKQNFYFRTNLPFYICDDGQKHWTKRKDKLIYIDNNGNKIFQCSNIS